MVIITRSPLQKDPSFPREGTEPCVAKYQYEVSENSHTKRPHGEKYIKYHSHTERLHGKEDIEFYKYM